MSGPNGTYLRKKPLIARHASERWHPESAYRPMLFQNLDSGFRRNDGVMFGYWLYVSAIRVRNRFHLRLPVDDRENAASTPTLANNSSSASPNALHPVARTIHGPSAQEHPRLRILPGTDISCCITTAC
jgi:hypothetical protein